MEYLKPASHLVHGQFSRVYNCLERERNSTTKPHQYRQPQPIQTPHKMIWAKLIIVLLLSILPQLALASPAINVLSHIGFLPHLAGTLTRRITSIDSKDDIPPTCTSACPDSLVTAITSCSASTRKKVAECQCGKGSAVLDQWTKCDTCLEAAFAADGITYTSYKPNCMGMKKSAGERSFCCEFK